MNFFEHQERARRRTLLLATYFLLAMTAIVLAVGLCLYLAALYMNGGQYPLADWLRSDAMLWSSGLTLLVVLAGSAHKAWQLRRGGIALAELLAADEVPPDTIDHDNRQLRNVVEEMAIASGIPAPRTFILSHEPAINAMVAGFRPTEAVVFVTQGAIDQLSRDELQGVIAHEFSHIFNADMRLNMRLMSVLAGILAIGKVGEFLLHGNTRIRHRHDSGKSSVSSVLFMILLGLALMVIGYLGLFFGRLIKAAISRQRELLADASSVQFTRNPAGIANALIKIRNQNGSFLNTVHGEDMSHMCFGATVPFHWQALLATHPPVDERLKALGGEWLARARVRQRQDAPAATAAATVSQGAATAGAGAFAAVGGAAAVAAPMRPLANRIGKVDTVQLGYAQSLLESIPTPLRQRLRQPESARWLVCALIVSQSRSEAATLTATLPLSGLEKQEVLTLAQQCQQLGTRLRLPLIDLALPALKQLDADDRHRFLDVLTSLSHHDGRLSLFEFCLTRILADHLGDRADRAPRIRFRRYGQLANQLQLVLSIMVHASGARDDAARELFQRAAGGLLPAGRHLLEKKRCRLDTLESALTDLRDMLPMLKSPLLQGLADIVLADGKIQVAEAELLRAIATLIDCPLPPLQHTT